MGEGKDQTPPEQPTEPRMTVSGAALELGLSAEAVRSRIKRGTLQSVKEGSTVYVLLSADQTQLDNDQDNDQAQPEHDRANAQTYGQTELIDSLQDQIAYLRDQLAEERESRRRADTIIAQLSQANAALARRVPELEPAPEPRESPQTASEEPSGTQSIPGRGAALLVA
jgi:hypothetical protein